MQLDPSGEARLRLAKRVRRTALRQGGEEEVVTQAMKQFGLPATVLGYAQQLDRPLFGTRVAPAG